MDLREVIRTQPMRRSQLRIIALCIALAMLDGFEILIMAFVAPAVSRDWGLDSVQTGYLLSSGIVGMTIGAFVLSPSADKFGRRKVTLACLVIITIGMALSTIAGGLEELIVYRIVAGIGIGGLTGNLNIAVAEISSDKRRGVALGIYGAGLPAGGAVGGAVSGVLIAQIGWQSAFLFGTIMTAILLALSMWSFPESIDYLLERRPKNALAQYNKMATRLKCEPAERLPEIVRPRQSGAGRHGLFTGMLFRRTLLLWLGYSCFVMAFYFANTWSPKLLVDATSEVNLGPTVGVVMSIGGVLGAFIFATLSLRLRPRIANVVTMTAGAVAFIAYANTFDIVAVGMVLAALIGAFVNAVGFYAISPTIYPATVRGTGVGVMIGTGRLVSAAAPVIAGYLLSSGWTPSGLYIVFGVILILAAAFTFMLDQTYRGRSEDSETFDSGAVDMAATGVSPR